MFQVSLKLPAEIWFREGKDMVFSVHILKYPKDTGEARKIGEVFCLGVSTPGPDWAQPVWGPLSQGLRHLFWA